MKADLIRAARSLPMYLIGGFLFVPLLLAPFTLGASFAIYLGPFGIYKALFTSAPYAGESLRDGILLTFGPGVFVWTLRQFIRFAAVKRRSWYRG